MAWDQFTVPGAETATTTERLERGRVETATPEGQLVLEVGRARLEINRKTFDLVEITTVNVYGDETRIELKNIRFDEPPAETLFRFEVPEGTDILQMNP